MKKKISKILIIFLFIICGFTTVSFAQNEIKSLEKSEVYKRWESLSQETRNTTIPPRYYDISIKDSMRRSRYNTLLAGNTSLESVYDLSKLYNLIIKDQKLTGSCWAFSTTSILESMMYKKNLLVKEYSPFHIEYATYQMYNRVLGEGGNIHLAVAYLANGKGPVLESDFPMESVYDEKNNTSNKYFLTDIENVDLNKEAQLKLTDTREFSAIFKDYNSNGNLIYTDAYGNEYTEEQVTAVRKEIKTHIKNYGAVIASMYMDIAINEENGEFVSKYYDSEKNIFCCNNSNIFSTSSNHQVAIVGWDDNKKAYIVQNSYGEIFGDRGFFYVSYDDVRIEEGIYGIIDFEQLTSNKNYDNKYIYDELGPSQAITYSSPEIYYANVFERDANIKNKEEYINEVGLYILNTTGIEIYVNAKDEELVDSNNNSKLKLVLSGEILEPGYHVIKLNATEDTKLTGNKFVVAVKAINQESAIIPIECNLYESNFVEEPTFFNKARANEGESLYSLAGKTWYELNGTTFEYYENYFNKRTVTLKNSNVCVRAFTKYVDKIVEEVAVTGIQLDKNSITLKEGKTEELIATVLPEDATNKNVIWTSSNEEVAVISNGIVTAIKEGTATITVTTEDGNYTASCEVTVEKDIIRVTGVRITPNEIQLDEGKTTILTATVLPLNAQNKNIIWSSSDENVATVSNGVVTAVGKGIANITVTTEDGNYTATAKVTVNSVIVNVTGVILSQNAQTLKVGETSTLKATVLPINATNKNITWSSSNTNVATVVNGVITAIGKGRATITVTTEDGNYTATCEIFVEEGRVEEVNVISVTLNKESETLKIGETLTLVPTISPVNATNKNITWSSSNTKVATVSNGVVTAVGKGKATITVETEDGKYTDTCEITVQEDVVNVSSIALNKNDETLKIGETISLVPTITPSNATNKNVTWSSSNTKVATVENGVVTAIKSGTAVITVETIDGKHKAICNITVEENIINVTGVKITVENVEMQVGTSLILSAEIIPENATNKNIMWESSDEEIAKVSNGVITALKPGVATITVRTEDGDFTDTAIITIKENKEIKVESIKLNKEKLQMEVSDKSTLIVTFNPEFPTNTNVKWESSNPKVATVDQNGIVTALKKGTAVITVTSEDGGYTAKCTVTVTKKTEDPDDIYKDQEDDSTSDKPLPNTGIETVAVVFAIVILIFMVYSFIRYKRLKDVK